MLRDVTIAALAASCAVLLVACVVVGLAQRRSAKSFKLYCSQHIVRQNLLRASEGIYWLVSIDGGRNYVELRQHPDGSCHLIGTVDREVVERLDANLATDVGKNSTIDLGDSRRLVLMQTAGPDAQLTK